MSGLGANSGAYNPASVRTDTRTHTSRDTNRASEDASKVSTENPEVLSEEADVKQQQNANATRQENNNAAQDKAKQADSFHRSSESSIPHTATVGLVSSEAARERLDKAKKTAEKLNNMEVVSEEAQSGEAKASVASGKEASSNQALASTASQSQVDTIDPDEAQADEGQSESDFKLEQIFLRGGDKGKAFVAFARREIGKGRLHDIEDLIDGMFSNLRNGALTSAEMIADGPEVDPLRLLTTMTTADNPAEWRSIINAIANSAFGPTGMKQDAMYLRNLDKSEAKKAPPKPNYVPKKNSIETAVEYVTALNRTSDAPWDNPALAAA